MALSQMMQHYLEVKRQYPDCVIFYRLGDFYEMFFEDAENISKELELTLTGKDCGLEKRAPMCGIPFHAAAPYIEKLVNKGYKVALCEQLTAPKKGVKLVERDVVKVVTPGTVFEPTMLDDEKNNYIFSIYLKGNECGVAWADVSTGEISASNFNGENLLERINQILIRIKPSEIICNEEALIINEEISAIKEGDLPKASSFDDFSYSSAESLELYKKQFKANSMQNNMQAITAISSILAYLNKTQKQFLCHINTVKFINNNEYMVLDTKSRRNLELLETSVTHKKYGSLIGVLDKTKTSMGARLLRNFINEPLVDINQINLRLNAVEEFYLNPIKTTALREELSYIRDIERLTAKISGNSLMPRDTLALLESFKSLPKISYIIKDFKSSLIKNCFTNLTGVDEVVELLSKSMNHNAPLTLKEGGYIKGGFSAELDEFRLAKQQGNLWLAELEAKEKEETNIKNLKIGYNNNFGYYLEVLHSQKELVPFRYIRKQTTLSYERYITEELKELESKILNADENAIKLETALFNQIRLFLINYVEKFQSIAKAIASLDVFSCFAQVSANNKYVKPKMVESGEIIIENGRHPVVETTLKDGIFNPNNTFLDADENRTMLITGPNMAGKSTYMRQVALITLMAHIGSFVPATKAVISVTDRIFTRIGASDDLAFGQSTFMVEMVEVANILQNATGKSLILLDEVGRGTSTFDGLSIAYAIMDYLSSSLKAKTLFATHYHELTSLEATHKGIKNYSVAVKEFAGEIIFLHKIAVGGANKSFGIEVAALAGLPKNVINKAKEYLKKIESKEITINTAGYNKPVKQVPSVTLKEKEVLSAIQKTNTDLLSPINALDLLINLKEKLNKGE